MIITCPVCSTQYAIDGSVFPEEGRTVKCSNCATKWVQEKLDNEPAPAQAQPQMHRPAAMPMAQQREMMMRQHMMDQPMMYPGMMQQPMMPQGMMQPGMMYPGMMPQQPMAQPGMMPPQQQQPMPQQQPAPQPEPEPEYDYEEDDDFFDDEPELETEFDDIPEPEPEPEPEPVAAPTADDLFGPEDDDNPSDEEIEAMFDDVPDEIPAISSMMENIDNDPDDIDGFDEFDDDDDMPTFTSPAARAAKEKKKGGAGKIIAILVVLLGGIGAGLFFAKDMVIAYVPALAPYYEMAGIGGGNKFEGLKIVQQKVERSQEGENQVLKIVGWVQNNIDQPLQVPMVRISLFDDENTEIQGVTARPTQAEVGPGEKVPFKATIERPDPRARRIEMTLTDKAPEPAAH